MDQQFSFTEFRLRFPNDDSCLEEIKKLRFPRGVACRNCQQVTKHYKVNRRPVYSCQICRTQVYPLKGTAFEKSSTPLRLWFYCFYLMTQTRAEIPIISLQRELGVTYKTAWRMYTMSKKLMAQNNGDLLFGGDGSVIRKWVFFNKIEFTVSQTKDSSI